MKSEIITRIEKEDKVIELDFEEGRELYERLGLLYAVDFQASLPLNREPLTPSFGTYVSTNNLEENSEPMREIAPVIASIRIKKNG